jgi:hypothetical protein
VSNAQLGGTLENQSLNELPINGRQYTYLIAFGQAPSTPDGKNPVIGSGSPREIQLGMKLIFWRIRLPAKIGIDGGCSLRTV